MPQYRRAFVPGATFFFTVVTHDRRSVFSDSRAVGMLRQAVARARIRDAFEIDGMVVLPDHLHCVWRLPEGDSDFSTRWRYIKSCFTRGHLDMGGREGRRSQSRRSRGERGIWQRRFWEHVVRDEDEYAAYMDYIHYNPVKHEHCDCPHAWPHSSFHRWVREGVYDADWCCCCNRRAIDPPDLKQIEDRTGE